MSFRAKIMAITPIVCLGTFLLLGFQWDLWHPGWLVLFLIPIMPFLLGYKKFRFSVSLVIVIIYLYLGLALDLWHPGWLIFLLIPIIHILITPSKHRFKVIFDDNKDQWKSN